jgi:hypothetical protein
MSLSLQAGTRLSGGELTSEIQAQKCAVLDDKTKEILHQLLHQEKMLQRQQREIQSIQMKQRDRIPPNIKGKSNPTIYLYLRDPYICPFTKISSSYFLLINDSTIKAQIYTSAS